MKRKNGFSCWICDDHSIARDTTLIGGYHARLCNDHLNDWHKYIREHEVLLERDDLRIETHLAAERLEEEQMKVLLDEMRRNDRLLYALGETWVEAAIISHAMDERKNQEEL